jgi:hypothetical protein
MGVHACGRTVRRAAAVPEAGAAAATGWSRKARMGGLVAALVVLCVLASSPLAAAGVAALAAGFLGLCLLSECGGVVREWGRARRADPRLLREDAVTVATTVVGVPLSLGLLAGLVYATAVLAVPLWLVLGGFLGTFVLLLNGALAIGLRRRR